MKPLLYVVGTSHHYQFGAGIRFGEYTCSTDDQVAFSQMLRSLAVSKSVEVIAEELNEQALQEVGSKISIPKLLAQELRLQHIFCEPNRVERTNMGIFDENEIRISVFPNTLDEVAVQKLVKESWERREEEWIHRLSGIVASRLIFVCGSNHIVTFVPLVAERGFQPIVVHENWVA